MTQLSGNWAWIASKNPGALSHESRLFPTPKRTQGRYGRRLGSFYDLYQAKMKRTCVDGAGNEIARKVPKQAGGSGRTGRRVFVWDARSEQMISVLESSVT